MQHTRKGWTAMDSKKTGVLISTLRKGKGMTQKELADRLHVSDRTVSKWERGAGFPDVSLMMKLADTLGISVNELLQGERRPEPFLCEETENEVRDAVTTFDQQARAKGKQIRRRILAAGFALLLLAAGFGLLFHEIGETQILFPPKISCEILQNDILLEAELVIDRSNSGVLDYVCAYEMDTYGNTLLYDRKQWQSYTDVVEAETYQALRSLHTGALTAVSRLENGGFLAQYDENPTVCSLIETDENLTPVFSYEIDAARYTNACEVALITERRLYVLSYQSTEDRLSVTTVNKATGKEHVCDFSYADLKIDVGGRLDANAGGSLGGFLFDGARMWVQDDVLCFAETYYGGQGCRAVLGMLDLQTQQVRIVQSEAHAQVVMVRHDAERGTASVLINPMGYAPLELYTLDDRTMEILQIRKLALPHEYLTQKNSVYAAESYLLFDGDIKAQYAAVLFDVTARQQAEAGIRNAVLAAYDMKTGEMVWRGRFELDSDYDICGVRLRTNSRK